MANAFTLFGSLRADTSDFERGMRNAEAGLSKFDKAYEASAKRREQFAQRTALLQQKLDAQTAQVSERLATQTNNLKQKLAQQAEQFQIKTALATQKNAQTSELAQQRLAQQSSLVRMKLAQQNEQFQIRTANSVAKAHETAQRRAQVAAENAAKASIQAWQGFGNSLKNIGAVLTATITLPLIAVGSKILTAGIDYEKALNMFQAVTKATADEMKRAADVSKQLGADISLPATSAKNAALAMTELAKAGLTANQAMAATKGVLQLAAAGQLDEARAAEIAANALNAFRLEASQTVRVADLLSAASNASSAEVSDIAEALKQASAGFAQAKVPIEDVTAAIAQLANAGIKGSDAGTSLKTFLSRIQAPTDAAADAMSGLGIKVFDLQGRLKPMATIIGDFQKSLAGLSDEKQAQIINTIFGADASRAASILFTQGAEGFEKIKKAVTEAGAAQELSAAKTKGLGGAWEAMKSQLETIGIDIFNVIKEPLTQALQVVGRFVSAASDAFSQLSPSIQTAIIGFTAFVAGLAPLVVVAGIVVSAVTAIVSAVTAVIGVFGGVGAAAAVVGAVLAAVGVYLTAISVASYALYQAWQTNFGGIQQIAQTVSTSVQSLWSSAMTAIGSFTQEILAEISTFWAENGEDIKKAVSSVGEAIKLVWQTNLTNIQYFWAQHGSQITAVASAIWEAVKAIVMAGLSIVLNLIKLTTAIINNDWESAWDAIKNIVSSVWDAIAKIVYIGVEVTKQFLIGLVTFFYNLGNELYNAGVNAGTQAANGLIEGIKNNIPDVKSAGLSLAGGVINAATGGLQIQSPSKVFIEIGKNIVLGLVDGITTNSKSAVSAVSAMVKDSIATAKEEIGKLSVEFQALKNTELFQIKVKSFGIEKAKESLQSLIDLRLELGQNLNSPLPQTLSEINIELEALKKHKESFDLVKEAVNKLYDKSVDLREQFAPAKWETDVFDEMTKDFNVVAEAAKKAGQSVEEFLKIGRAAAEKSDILKGFELISQFRPDAVDNSQFDPKASSPVFQVTDFGMEFDQLKGWSKILADVQSRVSDLVSELPSLNDLFTETFVNLPESIGDVFANAVSQWDGTLKGFFSSVAQGFAQMVQQIAAELMKLAMVKLVAGLIGSIGGGFGFGGGGMAGSSISTTGVNTSIIGGFASGGFTGFGSNSDIAGMVHKNEFVMPAETVRNIGVGNLEAIKQGKMPGGGTTNNYSVTMNVNGVQDLKTWNQSKSQIGREFLTLIQQSQLKTT